MEEKIRVRKARERIENVLDSLLEKTEGLRGRFSQEEKIWGGLADFLEAIAELCTSLERDIPGTGGGGQRRYPYRIIPRTSETATHFLRCSL